jgi:D-alanyl-D-alanine carboxypeptidase (penicillin-binding protein 5/6)
MKNVRKRTIGRIIKLLFIQILLITALLVWGKSLYTKALHREGDSGTPSQSGTQDVTPSPNADAGFVIGSNMLLDVSADTLYSRNIILVRTGDRKVLYSKNSSEVIYPASLTKIMTAITAIENLGDLDRQVTLSPNIFDKLNKEDASMAGFLPGEAVDARDLLYGMLLPSGAECCVGFAEYISGSEEELVKLMNEKAEELGMDHTHFTNTTGLQSLDHYTTVGDLALLLEYALQNDTFRDIFTSKKHTTEPTNLHPDGITFSSTMFKNLDSADFKDGTILGGKTGFTSEAGLCLASLAVKDNEEYILITAGADGNHSTEQYNISDALYVYSHLD